MVVNSKQLYKEGPDGILEVNGAYIDKAITGVGKTQIPNDIYPEYKDVNRYLETEPKESIIEKIKFCMWGVIRGINKSELANMSFEDKKKFLFEEISFEDQEKCLKNIVNSFDSEDEKSEKEEAFLAMKYFLEDGEGFVIKGGSFE